MPTVRTSKPVLAEAVFNVPDEADNVRLECLRLAAQRGGTLAEIVDAAEAFLAFMRPRKAEPKPVDLFPEVPTVSP